MGRFTPDSQRHVFQRTRELEDKLEAQRRHLKELEEKVGGWSSGRPLGLFPWNLFSCPLVTPQVQPLSPAPPPTPSSAPSPQIGTSKTPVTASSTFLGKKCSLGSTLSMGCGEMPFIFTKDLP